MDLYYGTVASLPTLLFENELPLTRVRFLEVCRDALRPHDYALLSMVGLDATPEAGLDVLSGFGRWLETLRGELARLRASKLSRDSEPYAHRGGFSAQAADLARTVVNDPSPAHAETAILRAAFRELDNLEVGHYFDLEKLVVYFLKLQLLELKAARNPHDGRERFHGVYDAIFTQRTSLAVSGEQS